MKNTRTARLIPTLLLALAAMLAAPSAEGRTRRCPRLSAEKPFVYAIGSSTLGISLGPLLTRDLPEAGFRFRKWAKASSGLARPDFHDWPARIPEITQQWKPDVILISLGTNDFQAIRNGTGWIKPEDADEWRRVYTERVRNVLRLAAGPDNERVVIWVGPSVFNQPRARKLARIINEIVSTEIARFEGPAFHVDVYSQLTDSRGRPQPRFTVPGSSRRVATFGHDRIHLTRDAVLHLMANPVLGILRTCKEGGSVEVSGD